MIEFLRALLGSFTPRPREPMSMKQRLLALHINSATPSFHRTLES